MKKTVAVLLIVLLVALTGCRGNSTTPSAPSGQSNVPSEDSQGAPSLKNPAEITKEQVAQSLQDFKAEINSLDSAKITKFQITKRAYGQLEVVYTTEDTALIKQWVSVFKKMKFTAEVRRMEDGTHPDSYSYVTDTGEEKMLCTGNFPRFFHDDIADIEIVNQDDLSKEFEELRSALGISK